MNDHWFSFTKNTYNNQTTEITIKKKDIFGKSFGGELIFLQYSLYCSL